MQKVRTGMNYENYLENLENKLRNSFDLYRDYPLGSEMFNLYARYYIRTERYMLSKKAKIYGLESHEHILLKHLDSLDEHSINDFTDCIVNSIEEVVEPHPEHMSSIVTGVMVVENSLSNLGSDLVNSVRKFNYHKGYSFGLRGWVDVRILIVSLKDGIVISNKKGREVEKLFKV